MYFVRSPVVFSYFSKSDDSTSQRSLLSILLLLDQHHPTLSLGEPPGSGFKAHLSRLHDIQDKDASAGQRVVHATEELNQISAVVVRIEQVVEAFTERRHGLARWNIGLEQRRDPKLRVWRSSSGDAYHRLGDVDPEDTIAGLRQLSRPQAASATQIDHQPLANPVSLQDLQYAGGGSKGEVTVTDIMDKREVFFVPLRHNMILAPAT